MMGFGLRPLPIPRARSIERLIAASELAADAGEALRGGVVVAADIERPRVGAGGLLLVLHPLVGEAAAGPRLDVLRIEQDRVVEIACGRLEVVDRQIAQAARDEGGGVVLRQA